MERIKDKIIFIVLIVVIIVILLGFAYFGVSMLVEGKTFSEALSDIGNISISKMINEVFGKEDSEESENTSKSTKENTIENNTVIEDNGVSELKQYESKSQTVEKTEELLNLLVTDYMDYIDRIEKESDSEMRIYLSDTIVDSSSYSQRIIDLFDEYIRVLKESKYASNTYIIFSETDTGDMITIKYDTVQIE